MSNTVEIIIKAADLASKDILKLSNNLTEVFTLVTGIDKVTFAKIVSSTVSWNSELNKTQRKLASVEVLAKKLVALSTKLTFSGLAALATVAFPIAQAAAFEASMSKVKAVLDGVTDESMQKMIDQAQLLGETTKFTGKESAEAFTFLAMAGLSAEEAISALPGVLELAAAGGLDLATSADLATNVLAGMGMEVEQLAHVNDVLAVAASKSNTSVLELGEAMKIAGPAALGSGESIEHIIEALGGLANAGIKGGEAGNAVKRMLILLQDPTEEAADTMARLGVETEGADGKFRGLLPILADLGSAQLTLSDSAKIFGLYTGAAAVAAATQASSLGDLRIALSDADGAAGEMATTMEDNVSGAFTRMGSAIEGFWLAVASPLNDFVQGILDNLAKLISFGTSVVKTFSYVTNAVFGSIAVFGILGTLLGSLGIALGTLLIAYTKWRTLVLLVTGANWLLTKALASQRLAVIANTLGFTSLTTTLARSKVVLDAFSLSTIRSVGIMGTLSAVINVVKVAAIGLFNVLKANPYAVLVTAGLTFYTMLSGQKNKYNELKLEADEYAKSLKRVNSEYKTLQSAFVDASVLGIREDQLKTAAELKDWLVALADSNDELAISALNAADSIDDETGAFSDGGDAIDEFHRQLSQIKFGALVGQLSALNAELESKKTTGWKNNFVNALTGIHLSINQHLINPFTELIGIHFKSFDDRAVEMEEQWAKSLTSMEAKTRQYVAQMLSLGGVDPNISLEEFVILIDSIPELSEEMKTAMTSAFTSIKAESKGAGESLSKTFSEEENAARLTKFADGYRQMADDIISEYRRISSESDISPTVTTVTARNTSYQEVMDILPKYVASLQAVANDELALSAKVTAKRIADVQKAEDTGLISKNASARIQARIVAEASATEVEIRTAAFAKLNELGDDHVIKSSDSYKKLAQDVKNASSDQLAAEQLLQANLLSAQVAADKKKLESAKGTYSAIEIVASNANTSLIKLSREKGDVEKAMLTEFLELAKSTYDDFVKINRDAYDKALAEVEKYAEAIDKVNGKIVDDDLKRQATVLEIQRKTMSEKEKEASLAQEYGEKLKAVQDYIAQGDYDRAEAAAQRAIDIARGFTDEQTAIDGVNKAYASLAKVREGEKTTLADSMSKAAEKAEAFNVELRKANNLMSQLAEDASSIDLGAESFELDLIVPDTIREDIQSVLDKEKLDVDLDFVFNEQNAESAKISIEELMQGVTITPEVDDSEMTKGVDDFVARTKRIFKNSEYKVEVDMTDAQRTVDKFISDFKRAFADAGSSASSGVTVRRRLGGFISGYGGGDKVRALLEKGEYVLRKEAVRKYGVGLIKSLNNLSFGPSIRRQNGGPVNDIISTPVPSVSSSSVPGDVKILKFSFDDGASTSPMTVASQDATLLISQFRRMGRLSSI